MMYEMKNLFSLSKQEESADNASSLLLLSFAMTSSHGVGSGPTVTSEGVGDEQAIDSQADP